MSFPSPPSNLEEWSPRVDGEGDTGGDGEINGSCSPLYTFCRTTRILILYFFVRNLGQALLSLTESYSDRERDHLTGVTETGLISEEGTPPKLFSHLSPRLPIHPQGKKYSRPSLRPSFRLMGGRGVRGLGE